MLENVDRWLEQWRKPVWEALYRRDEENCRRELAQAIAGWEMYAATTDERQAARLYLDFLQCQVDESFQAARDLKRGIVLDARPPNVVRICPSPLYNGFADLRAAVEALASA